MALEYGDVLDYIQGLYEGSDALERMSWDEALQLAEEGQFLALMPWEVAEPIAWRGPNRGCRPTSE